MGHAGGNIIFTFYDEVVNDLARKRVAGIRPERIRWNMRESWREFLPIIEPLRPIITAPLPTEPRTPAKRRDANLKALRLLASGKEVDAWTAVQTYARYTGMGGLTKKGVNYPKGYEPSEESLRDEYYTPIPVAAEIAKLLCPFLPRLADQYGRIRGLEPSAGVGRLIAAFNRECHDVNIFWDAVEVSPIVAAMLRKLHPEASVYVGPYEAFNEEKSEGGKVTPGPWGLVVANPPFGSSAKTRQYATLDTDGRYASEEYDYPYFLRRSLDSLAVNGIGVYIVPSGFLGSTSPRFRRLRERILLSNHLMGAYRLPTHLPKSDGSIGEGIYSGQFAGTDLVLFRRRGGRLAKLADEDKYIATGEYFDKTPKHVLGKKVKGYRDAIVGKLEIPPLVERPLCVACVFDTPDVRRPRKGSVARRLQARVTGEAYLVLADALGQRVRAYLARTGGDVRAQREASDRWFELVESLIAFKKVHGNPHRNSGILALKESSDNITYFLTAYDLSGSLSKAMKKRPVVVEPFTGRPNEIEKQARWIWSQKQALMIDDLHAFHASIRGRYSRDELVARLLETRRWFIRPGERLEPREIYLSGNLWPKFDEVTNRSEDPQLALQEQELLKAIDPRTFTELGDVSPRDSWLPLELVSAWMTETLNGGEDVGLARVDGLIRERENAKLTKEARWCIGWLNHINTDFDPDNIVDPKPYYAYGIPEAVRSEIQERLRKADDKLSTNVQRVLIAGKWNHQFEKWIQRNPDLKVTISRAYNRKFRGFVRPDYDSTPLNIQRWTDDPKLALRAHQIRMAKARIDTRGGLLGDRVGVGKTFASLAYIAYGRQEGWIKRPVILVPAGLAFQWEAEISKVLPDYSVLVIGRKRVKVTKGSTKGEIREKVDTADERARKWTEFQAGLWDVVLVTPHAFTRLKVDPEILERYVKGRSAMMRDLKIEMRIAEKKKVARLTEREKAILKMGARAWVEQTIAVKGDLDRGPTLDELKIDCLVVDELGDYRKTFSAGEREFGMPKYMGQMNDGSKRGWQVDMRCAVVRENASGRGILLLSGTFGETTPIEFFSAFHMLDPTIFESLGIYDPEAFVDRYCDIRLKRVLDITGSHSVAPALVGFKHLTELREILHYWGTYLTAERAGVEVPEREITYKRPPMNATQREKYQAHRATARRALQDDDRATAFAAINRMRQVSLHPLGDEGYDWTTANGGRGTKEVSKNAIDYWLERGWEPKTIWLERRLKSTKNRDKISDLRKQLSKIEKRQRISGKVLITKDLPRPALDQMGCPKFDAIVELIQSAPSCCHLVFCESTAQQYWLRETLVRAGFPREQLGIANGKVTEKLTDFARKLNGTDEEEPQYRVGIINKAAERGANLQRNTYQGIHYTIPWNSATIVQRDGRYARPGNPNRVVRTVYLFSQGSFDPFILDTVSGKANWNDILMIEEGAPDRATNPLAQLEMTTAQMWSLTADNPEEQAQFIEQLRKEREREENQRARRRAVGHMAAAAEKYSMSRRVRDPERRNSLVEEAIGKLNLLALTGNEVWPWKSIQDRVREHDVIVYKSADLVPVFSGLLYEKDGVLYEVGRVWPHEQTFGAREFGSPVWATMERPPENVRVVTVDEWDRADDYRSVASKLDDLLSGSVSWEKLGWFVATEPFVKRFWESHGARVVSKLDGAVPLLDGGGIRLAAANELQTGQRSAVIEPSIQGWAVFRELVRVSIAPLSDLESLARRWWRRELPDLKKLESITCPGEVYRLRPPSIMPQLERRHSQIKASQRQVTVSLTDVESNKRTVTVKLGAGHSVESLAELVMRAIYARYAERVESHTRALAETATEPASEELWKRLSKLRADSETTYRNLDNLVGYEAASVIDRCATRRAGVELTLPQLLERVFRPHIEGEWWKKKRTLKTMKRDLARVLQARGLDNGDNLAARALAMYVTAFEQKRPLDLADLPDAVASESRNEPETSPDLKPLSKQAAKTLNLLVSGLAVADSRKIALVSAFMPVSVDRLDESRFAVAHNYVQNGDVIADPDVEFLRLDADRWIVVAIQHPPPAPYQRLAVYDNGQWRASASRQQVSSANAFVASWMKRIIEQQGGTRAIRRYIEQSDEGTEEQSGGERERGQDVGSTTPPETGEAVTIAAPRTRYEVRKAIGRVATLDRLRVEPSSPRLSESDIDRTAAVIAFLVNGLKLKDYMTGIRYEASIGDGKLSVHRTVPKTSRTTKQPVVKYADALAFVRTRLRAMGWTDSERSAAIMFGPNQLGRIKFKTQSIYSQTRADSRTTWSGLPWHSMWFDAREWVTHLLNSSERAHTNAISNALADFDDRFGVVDGERPRNGRSDEESEPVDENPERASGEEVPERSVDHEEDTSVLPGWKWSHNEGNIWDRASDYAYTVADVRGKWVVYIDTPGNEENVEHPVSFRSRSSAVAWVENEISERTPNLEWKHEKGRMVDYYRARIVSDNTAVARARWNHHIRIDRRGDKWRVHWSSPVNLTVDTTLVDNMDSLSSAKRHAEFYAAQLRVEHMPRGRDASGERDYRILATSRAPVQPEAGFEITVVSGALVAALKHAVRLIGAKKAQNSKATGVVLLSVVNGELYVSSHRVPTKDVEHLGIARLDIKVPSKEPTSDGTVAVLVGPLLAATTALAGDVRILADTSEHTLYLNHAGGRATIGLEIREFRKNVFTDVMLDPQGRLEIESDRFLTALDSTVYAMHPSDASFNRHRLVFEPNGNETIFVAIDQSRGVDVHTSFTPLSSRLSSVHYVDANALRALVKDTRKNEILWTSYRLNEVDSRIVNRWSSQASRGLNWTLTCLSVREFLTMDTIRKELNAGEADECQVDREELARALKAVSTDKSQLKNTQLAIKPDSLTLRNRNLEANTVNEVYVPSWSCEDMTEEERFANVNWMYVLQAITSGEAREFAKVSIRVTRQTIPALALRFERNPAPARPVHKITAYVMGIRA